MISWITLGLAVGAYSAFIYFSQKWVGKNIDKDNWWDKYPEWLGWVIFAGWLPILALLIGFIRTFYLARWLFGGEEYCRDFWDDVPDFG